MSNQHRLRALHVGVGGHGSIPGLLGAIEEYMQQFRQCGADFVACCPRIQAQVSGDLFVPTAPAMELETNIADKRDQLLLDKMMHVLGFVVLQKFGRCCGAFADFLQAMEDGAPFVGREDACFLEGAGMSRAGLEFAFEQTAIELEGSLPAGKGPVELLPEAARPHFHRATSVSVGALAESLASFAGKGFLFSGRLRARDREGNPRMRMKPAASF